MYNRNRREIKKVSFLRGKIKEHFHPIDLSELLKMESKEDIDPIFKKLESFIERNVRGITSTQLRNIADVVQGVSNRKGLNVCRPRLAHMIAKQPREEAKNIMLLADELAGIADDVTCNGYDYFVQCLLAFHKYYDVLGMRQIETRSLVRLVETDLKTSINTLLKIDATNIDQVHTSFRFFLTKNAQGITSTQLRNIFDQMKGKSLQGLRLMKPALAYTAARQSKQESVKLVVLIMELLKRVNSSEHFLQVMEMIVSIHKYQETINKIRLKPKDLLSKSKEHFGEHANNLLTMDTATSEYASLQEKIQGYIINQLNGIKPSQFRRLFDAVMEANSVFEIKQLRPLFLYTAARQNNEQSIILILFFEDIIKQLTEKQMQPFKKLLLDMMAYHRYFASDSIKDKTIKNLAI